MALSRKRRKELNRLKGQAEDLWEDQKELLDHAAKVVRQASRQAALYAREEVAPRVRDTVAPAVGAGLAGARSAASTARDRLTHDVLPGVTGALGTALAAIEAAKDKQLRAALKQAAEISNDVGRKVGIVKPQPAGPGRYILIGLGVVAVAAVAYAAWQTLRADDDLWIEDDAEPLEAAEGAPPAQA